jgi:MFS family permease
MAPLWSRLQLLNRLWPMVPAVLALAVYRATMAPDLTWAHNGADGGDLLAAALTSGVAHPSGYPTYLVSLRLIFTLVGNPSAFWGNLFSAFAASGAVAFVALASAHGMPNSRALAGHRNASLGRLSIAIGTALLAAFAPTLWSQAVITEVYTLHAFFTAALLYLALRVEKHPVMSVGTNLITGLLLGVGLGNHLSLALLIPGLFVSFWLAKARWSWRALSAMAVGCVTGLLIYLYLPWAARGDPPVNWGNPRDLPRLWWLVSGHVYRPLVFALPLSWLPWRLSAWANLLLQNLTLPGLTLALLGLRRAAMERRELWGMTFTSVGAFSLYALGYDTADSYVYLIPAYLALAPAIALGVWTLREEVQRWTVEHWPNLERPIMVLLAMAFAALPISMVWSYWEDQDLSQDYEAITFVQEALDIAAPCALIIAATDRPTFALWYLRYGLGIRPDVAIVNPRLYEFDWYRETVAKWHPDVAFAGGRPLPSAFDALVDANLHVRPVYTAEPLADLFTRYSVTAEGPLYRLQPRDSHQ